MMVLATATGIGGGIIRDLLLGAARPAAFRNELRKIARTDWLREKYATGLGVPLPVAYLLMACRLTPEHSARDFMLRRNNDLMVASWS